MPNYRAVARADAVKYGIDPNIFLAQINQESHFNKNARSSANAKGIAQFIDSTAAGYHLNPWDPVASLDAAARMDAANYKKYHNYQDVLSLYNSGRGWASGQHIGQTNNYVKSILGAAGSSGTSLGASKPSLAPPASTPTNSSDQTRTALLSYLMSGLSSYASTGQAQPLGQLAQYLASAQQAAPATKAAAPVHGAPPVVPGKYTGKIPFVGDTKGVKPSLLNDISAAAAAAGATQVRVISGYRSPSHNAAVGGASRSNHMTGDAMDGEAFVPGHGWVPLGQLVLPTARKYGLRSGDTPGFFHGAPDPNHVDDAANQY